MWRAGILGLAIAAFSGGALADTPAPKVKIDTGTLVGAQVDAARVFRAIPYAAAPVGRLRWLPTTARRVRKLPSPAAAPTAAATPGRPARTA
jgi:carboxylesterase type B